MKILITGVSGFIGFNLARRLHKQGHQIVAAARNAQLWQRKYPAYEWISCDFRQDLKPAQWVPRLNGVDLVINAVGIFHETQTGDFEVIQTLAPQALFTAAVACNKRILQISAMGAELPDVQEKFLATKRQADQFLLKLNANAVVLYPSIVIGRGGTSTRCMSQIAAQPLIPLIGHGEHKIQPLHIEDLCEQLAYIVQHWPEEKSTYLLVGPAALTMQELLAVLRTWVRLKPACYLPVPMALLRALARGLHCLGINSMLTTASLDLLETARLYPVANDIPAARPLAEALWDEPATHADTWYARLMLVRPFLVAAMAFVWIFTALTSVFFDLDSSYALLKNGGIEGFAATLLIYLGATADLALGIGMLMPTYRLAALRLQIGLMVGYSVIIGFIIPALWLHPLGPVTKNLPMLIGTALLLLTDQQTTLRFVKGR